MEGLVFLAIIVLAFYIWLAWYIAKQFAEVAQKKGHYEMKYFVICFLLGAIGYLLVIALPDRGNSPRNISDELPDL